MEWRPIETAPKDGTEILLAGLAFNDPSRGAWVVLGSFAYGRWHEVRTEDGEHLWPPTHWMPLPNPPVSE